VDRKRGAGEIRDATTTVLQDLAKCDVIATFARGLDGHGENFSVWQCCFGRRAEQVWRLWRFVMMLAGGPRLDSRSSDAHSDSLRASTFAKVTCHFFAGGCHACLERFTRSSVVTCRLWWAAIHS
jgi:hypothetical protein